MIDTDRPSDGQLGLFRRQRVVDVGLVVGSLCFGWVLLTTDLPDATTGDKTFAVAALIFSSALLLARRHAPIPVVVCIGAAKAALAFEPARELILLPAFAVALYALARRGPRNPNLVIGIATAAAVSFAVSIAGEEPFLVELLGELPQVLLPLALAEAVRQQRERFADRVESEAKLRVEAERLRIARDLHDVVAHGLSAMTVQSGVAAHLLDDDPEQARAALAAINTTGKKSLEDLRGVLGVLRSTDGLESGDRGPVPGSPANLSSILDEARTRGTEVRCEVVGEFPADTSMAVLVAFHRILDECLVNVSRHGGGKPADLRIEHGATSVELLITNADADAAHRSPPSTGVGVIGMKERATSVGGTFLAGKLPSGGFSVEATLPYGGPGDE